MNDDASNIETETAALTHVDAQGARMVDVAGKPVSARSATAEAFVSLNALAEQRVREKRGHKGDVLTVAQLAGIQAVKHTATLIPLCHPLPVDGVQVDVAMDATGGVNITATVRTTARTGVEMEALHAASVSALTVIDMVKAVQRDACLERVRLLEKTGGTKGDYRVDETKPTQGCEMRRVSSAWPVMRCGVLTVSDRASAGVYEDRGGPAVAAWLRERSPAMEIVNEVVSDEPEAIGSVLRRWSDASSDSMRLVLTTGGTGVSPRDVTPEVTANLVERVHPGLVEHARRVTSAAHPMACLSRGMAGVRGETLIMNLPGSPRGAVEWLEALGSVLPHALDTLAP